MLAVLLALAVPMMVCAEERIVRHEAMVHAPVGAVWKAFTTRAGVESWMVPVAEVDLRIGGTLQTNYNPQAKIGEAGTIVQHILAYEPERMLATRFTAPEGAPAAAKKAQDTWTVYRFEPSGAQDTRVTVTMLGWGEGPEWDASYDFFKRGNAWEMGELVRHFAGRSREDLMAGKVKTDRSVVIEKVVPIGAAKAFRMWTNEEGLKQFFSAAANVDPWAGGRYEIIFDPKGEPEARSAGSGGAKVLKLVPYSVLAFEWYPFQLDTFSGEGGPPRVSAAERNTRPLPVWVEVTFTPTQGGTRVRLESHGYRSGGKWDIAYPYFQNAWNVVMSRFEHACKEAVAEGPK